MREAVWGDIYPGDNVVWLRSRQPYDGPRDGNAAGGHLAWLLENRDKYTGFLWAAYDSSGANGTYNGVNHLSTSHALLLLENLRERVMRDYNTDNTPRPPDAA